MARKVQTLLIVLVAVLGFYAYNPMPSGLEEKWKYNVLVTAVRIMSDLAFVGGFLGLADERVCLRHVMASTSLVSNLDFQGINVTNTVFDGVQVRLYVPERPRSRRGGLIYLHGGGFIAGEPEGYDSLCLQLADRLDIVIVSVHYRRVPEHPSPAPLTDAYKAALYFFRNAAQWNVDRGFIGVAGDSAGGNLAAALALKLRDEDRARVNQSSGDAEGGFRLRFQVLCYPLLQGLTQNLPSYVQNDYHAIVWIRRWCVAGVVWTYIRGMENYRLYVPYQLNETHLPPSIKRRYGRYVDWRRLPASFVPPDFKPHPYHEHYMPHLDIAADLVNPYNFPLMADDLSGLPPSYIMTAEFDTIRDDGVLYAQRLQEAGVHVVHDYFANGWHGMVSAIDGFMKFDVSFKAMSNVTSYIHSQIEPLLDDRR